jgi:hypothetical protein
MGTRLVLCAQCGRHVRQAEDVCPFCSTPRGVAAQGGAGVLAASVVALLMAGCGGPGPGPVAVYGPPPQNAETSPPNEPAEEGEVPPPVEEGTQPPEEGPPPVAVYGPPPEGLP